MSVPSDAELLVEVRKARLALITSIAKGESLKVVVIGGQRIEEHDPDKLVATLDRLEARLQASGGDRQARVAGVG